MSGRDHLLLWGGAALVLVLVGGLLYLPRDDGRTGADPAARGEAPPREPLPAFELVNREGEPFGRRDLDGDVWIADFIFTRCAGPCPVMTTHMDRLREELPDEVRLVSFTVDPTWDTPEVLREYAEDYPWTFLTGEREAIVDLALDHFLATTGSPRDEEGERVVPHSSRFFLVDREGRVVGPDGRVRSYLVITREEDRWTRNDEAWEALLADARELLAGEEAPSAEHPGWIGRLPLVNACLNGLTFLLLVLGLVAIKTDRWRLHAGFMVAALVASALFLTSYLVYHAHAGSRPFQGEGWIRPVYFGVLVSHAVLAALLAPLVLATVWRAARKRWDAHRAIARWTYPIWVYVSVTGVLVYLMLYVWFPG